MMIEVHMISLVTRLLYNMCPCTSMDHSSMPRSVPDMLLNPNTSSSEVTRVRPRPYRFSHRLGMAS